MPSKSGKQARLMRMCASSRGRRRSRVKCPPKRVVQEFVRADRKRKRR